VFFCLQRMLGHTLALQQICLVQLVLQDHCKFQVRDDQYRNNVLGNVLTKVLVLYFETVIQPSICDFKVIVSGRMKGRYIRN
jgi:hypothetical protein